MPLKLNFKRQLKLKGFIKYNFLQKYVLISCLISSWTRRGVQLFNQKVLGPYAVGPRNKYFECFFYIVQ